MKKTIKENKVDDMFNDIRTGTGWASYDYILNAPHSPLSKTERIRLMIKLAKAGILVDDDMMTGSVQHKNQVPNKAFMSLQDLERKFKGRTSPNNEIMEDKVSGGLADKLTLQDIANKHKVDIDDLTKEFQKGVKVEKEHTSDVSIASEIARDHLFEDPKYYTKLATIENESINEVSNDGWYILKIDEDGDEKTIKKYSTFDKNKMSSDFNSLASKLQDDEELHFMKVNTDKKRVGDDYIYSVVNQDGKLKIEITKGNNTFYKKYQPLKLSESINESINVKDYEPVHGSYGFDKLAKMADTKNTIKISKSEFGSILKLLKSTGTDVLRKVNTEEYYTIYSLGNDYNLVRLHMKNEAKEPKGYYNSYARKNPTDKQPLAHIKSDTFSVAETFKDKHEKMGHYVTIEYMWNGKPLQISYQTDVDKLKKKSMNEDVKDQLMSGGMKTWWKYDKKDVMSFIYWLQRQIPPSGPKFDAEWKKIAAQLQKKHPAPKDEYEKIINEQKLVENPILMQQMIARKVAQRQIHNPSTNKSIYLNSALKDEEHPLYKKAKAIKDKIVQSIKSKFSKSKNESVINELEVGDKLQHKHNSDISIELVSPTNRGWKVKQTTKNGKKLKTVTQFYDDQDVRGDKSLFESVINESNVFTKSQIDLLRKGYETIGRVNPGSPAYDKLIKELDKLSLDKLKQLSKANIKWVSMLAANRVKRLEKHESLKESPKFKEKVDSIRKRSYYWIADNANGDILAQGETKADVMKQLAQMKKDGLIESINEGGEFTDQTGIKSSITRNNEFRNAVGDSKIIRWAMSDPVKIFNWAGYGLIFTDGKQEMIIEPKKPIRVLVPLQKVRNQFKSLYNNKPQSIDERKEFPTKEELIAYMVKGGHNKNSAKRVVDANYEYVKKHYQGSGLPKISDVLWTVESVDEAAHGYKTSDSSYITDHNDEYKLAKSIIKKVGGNEIKFYDELELLHDKLGHPKYMKWLSNALRGYQVDMYKDPKIKNKAEAEEALYLLSK